MDYKKAYNQMISKAQTRIIEGYTEKHHIIPRCVGGTDDKSNIISLTAREHFISHMLLCKIYPNNHKLWYAANMMANRSGYKECDYRVSARQYAEIRSNLVVSEITKSRMSESKKGSTVSVQTRLKISEAHKGKPTQPHSEATKLKISEANRGRVQSAETRLKRSLTKQNISAETKLKLSEANKGKPWSEKRRQAQLIKRNG